MTQKSPMLFNCSQLYIIVDALSSKENTVIEFLFIFLSEETAYLLRGGQQLWIKYKNIYR